MGGFPDYETEQEKVRRRAPLAIAPEAMPKENQPLKPRAKDERFIHIDTRRLDASRAPAVSRAATILRLLAAQRAGLGVTEIARRAGLVPSTCLHVLRALVDEGFTSFDSEKKTYQTGVGLLALVRDAMANSEYRKAVQPVLDRLAADHGVTAVAQELDSRGRMVLVATARPDRVMSLSVSVGSRLPAYMGATGRCIAAASGLSEAELRSQFASLRWEKAPRFEDWYAEVEQARTEGVAIDRGAYMQGLAMAGALLPKGADQATRGIAVVGLEHQMTDKVLRRVAEDLRKSAEDLSADMAAPDPEAVIAPRSRARLARDEAGLTSRSTR
jgi:DNA-binding IclR family transcriptional regulator